MKMVEIDTPNVEYVTNGHTFMQLVPVVVGNEH